VNTAGGRTRVKRSATTRDGGTGSSAPPNGHTESLGRVRDPTPEAVAAAGAPLLFTPAQAALRLAVPESWLRRQAGRRLIPRTFLGKHLRFSEADLTDIAHVGARPARRPHRTHR
jgi:hypothetical protein